jgi:prevent-host-death family protein
VWIDAMRQEFPGAGPRKDGEIMRRCSVVELRQNLSDALNRAEYRGERIVIHRRDRDAAALVSIEDLRLLERLTREEEDRIDVARSGAALEDAERVPLSALRAECEAPDEPTRRTVPRRSHPRRRQGAEGPPRKGS